MRKLLSLLGIAVVFCVFALSGGNVFSQEPEIDGQELQRRLLADIGVTEAEIMQFGIILAGVVEEYGPYAQEYQDRLDTAQSENYVEVVGDAFDNCIQPLFGMIRTEAANFFSEDQYAKLTTLMYQVAENVPESFGLFGVDSSLGLTQLFLLSDVVSLSDRQLADLAVLQKEVLTELQGLEIIIKNENAELIAELTALSKELEKAETEEEKAVIREKISKGQQRVEALMREHTPKLRDKLKTKLDTLLTAEQKAKLSKIKADIPDYLKKALAGMEAKSDEGSDMSSVLNSWAPGMGVPGANPNRETPGERTRSGGGRAFPDE